MRIEQVAPACVRQAWGLVRPEVEKLLKRFPDDFIAEDLYGDLTHTPAKAALFVMQDEKPVGFFVVELATAPRSLRRFLNVWILCGEGQMKYREQVLSYLDGLARAHACADIEMRTSRKGWIRALKGRFQVKTYVLIRKVNGNV